MTYTKNILIWALAVINVFFLAVFGWGLYRDNAVKKQMYDELYALMMQNGILLDTGNIHETGEMFYLDTSRNSDEEQRLAEALLGVTTAVDQGGAGVITTYIGGSGEAEFRTGGEFSIQFSQAVFTAGDNAESATRKILQSMGVETKDVEVVKTEDAVTATAVCAWNDYRIFDCGIQFVYKDGSLEEVSGQYIATIQKTDEKTEMSTSSAATALMRLLYAVKKEEKYDCLVIMDVSPGYKFAATVYGDGSLRPVWRIQADTGAFYVDAQTGDVEQAIA